jgi:hypothetical protein
MRLSAGINTMGVVIIQLSNEWREEVRSMGRVPFIYYWVKTPRAPRRK